MSRTSTDVLVVGGGPAGATIATRLAQLGHDVVLVDRGTAARRRAVESLPPGTVELLAVSGADRRVRAAGFTAVDSLQVAWETAAERRLRPGGLLVDRRRFDELLVEQAAAAGVEVWRPAHARSWHHDGSCWTVEITGPAAGVHPARARFLVEATGRPASPRDRVQVGARTIAASARWIDVTLEEPHVIAGDECWSWVAPSVNPDGGAPAAEVVVFADAARWRTLAPGRPEARYSELVRSMRIPALRSATVHGAITLADATPSSRTDVASHHHLVVGDAAVALDPLSSTGVQKAVQGALAGAVVVNTVLTRPAGAAVALEHHRQSMAVTAAHHARWAAESYALVARVRPLPFWTARAGDTEPPVVHAATPHHVDPRRLVRVSPQATFVEAPRLTGSHATSGLAVVHPALDGPTAYLGGVEIVPLLASLTVPVPLADVARSWAPAVTLPTALRLAGWLHRRGVLEEVGAA